MSSSFSKSTINTQAHVSLRLLTTNDMTADEENKDLSSAIFLPFNKYWELFVAVTIIINFLLCLVIIVFGLDFGSVGELVYYFCEVTFLIDTIAIIAHRNMWRQRRKKHHIKKSMFTISLRCISLLPCSEVYTILHDYSWEENLDETHLHDVTFCRLKCTLRLIILFMYFNEKKSEVAKSHLKLIVFQQITLILLLTCILSAVWYRLSCWKCEVANWTEHLGTYIFDEKSMWNWIVVSWYVVASVFAHNWLGDIMATTIEEKLWLIVFMLCGFVLHVMVFFGQLAVEFLQSYRCAFEYSTRIKKIFYVLDDWKVDTHVQERTIEYYRLFWQKYQGIKDVSDAFALLPLSLEKEVTVDIYWEFLRHSHLFRDIDIAFKRTVSLVMKTSFLLPGDYLIKLGEHKSKVIFITSGIVKVLSEEDNESSILCLSGGTLLSELSCLRITKSKANIKCETFCSIQFLELSDLHKLLVDYPGVTKPLQEHLSNRLTYARWAKSDSVPSEDAERNFKGTIQPIRTLKRQWKRIFKLNRSNKIDDSSWHRLNRTFTSDYLDTIVLSDNVQLKMKAICLNSKCPFIMDPDSSLRRFFDYVIIAAVLLNAIVLPYPIFFVRDVTDNYFTFLTVLDIVYQFDIYLQLSTAVNTESSKMITNSIDIILYRMKQTTFVVDILAAIPFAEFFYFLGMSMRQSILFKVCRLLKIYKVFQLISDKEQNIRRNYLNIRLIKYVLLCALIIYWCCNLLFASACLYEECFIHGWIAYKTALRKWVRKYNVFELSLFYSMSLVLNANITDQSGYALTDMILALIVVYFGYVVYGFCFAEFAASVMSQVHSAYEHQDQMAMFAAIMNRRGVEKDLRDRLMSILEFSWTFNEGASILGENGIFKEASEQLKSDIINERMLKCLKMVPLFDNWSAFLLKKFALQAQLIILPAQTLVLDNNVMSHYIYIIVRGYCQMNSMLPGDAERNSQIILKRGDMLALIETLHRLRMFGTITSTTAVELLSISYQTFTDILHTSQHEYTNFRRALQHHMKSFESILMRKGCRLRMMQSAEKALGRVDTFTYNIEEDDTLLPPDYYYKKPFDDLGRLSFVKYILLRDTINPCDTFFVTWEVFRCVLSFTDIILCLLYLNILHNYQKRIDVIQSIILIAYLSDIYIRMHCRYHTDAGILVTHPLLTARHYLKTSFLIDVLTVFPKSLIGITHITGTNYVEINKVFMTTLQRMLQLYKFFKAMTLLESMTYEHTGTVIMQVKIVTMLMMLLMFAANIVMMLACDKTVGKNVNCEGKNWIDSSYFKGQTKPDIVFAQTMYFTIGLFSKALCGIFSCSKSSEMFFLLCLTSVFFILRTWILAVFTSSKIGGNVNLSEYQISIKNFLEFSKQNVLEETLVKETVEHYAHEWNETLGTDVSSIAKKFNVYLRIRFVLSLYEDTLRSTKMFADAPIPVLERVVSAVEEMHFKRGANIIRCNDVQGKLYFVRFGQVEVAIADTVLATLEAGGAFGCFAVTGVTRQTISATAKTHTTVLALDGAKVNYFLEEWEDKVMTMNLRNIRLMHTEFMDSRQIQKRQTEIQRSNISSNSKYATFLSAVNKCIGDDNKWYRLFDYLLNVHIAALSSILIMVNLCVTMQLRSHPIMSAFIYTMDVLFLTKIFFGSVMYYTDSNTGLQVTDSGAILLRYIKTDFALHVVSSIPLELILLLFFKSYSKFGTANRILRFAYFQKYYIGQTQRLTVTKSLRWSYLFYWTTFQVQIMANIWFLVACFGSNYCKRAILTGDRPKIAIGTHDKIESTIYGYSYVLNMLTSCGFRDAIPTNIWELLASIVIAVMSQFITVHLASGFANIIIIENSTLYNFQHQVLQLGKYLKHHKLSPIIFDNVWNYLLQLWKLQHGEWMPKLITKAPRYLKQDIMHHLYGYHLLKHFLFESTHKDFVRQLVALLQRRVFLPGNVIVEKGDKDSSMYFVHSGEVGVYERFGTNEILTTMLCAEKTFGEEQGLYDVPYSLTYKAITSVDILSLTRSNWIHLLEWFPASHEMIRQKAKEYGLRK